MGSYLSRHVFEKSFELNLRVILFCSAVLIALIRAGFSVFQSHRIQDVRCSEMLTSFWRHSIQPGTLNKSISFQQMRETVLS